METERKIHYASNIKCEGCVAKVTPGLDALAGKGNWQVDINSPSKILTVKGEVTLEELNETLGEKGYRARPL